MKIRTAIAAAAFALSVFPASPVTSGIGASAGSAAATANSPAEAPLTKIMTVVLENTNYDTALRQPFLASLATKGVLLTHFTAEAHKEPGTGLISRSRALRLGERPQRAVL